MIQRPQKRIGGSIGLEIDAIWQAMARLEVRGAEGVDVDQTTSGTVVRARRESDAGFEMGFFRAVSESIPATFDLFIAERILIAEDENGFGLYSPTSEFVVCGGGRHRLALDYTPFVGVGIGVLPLNQWEFHADVMRWPNSAFFFAINSGTQIPQNTWIDLWTGGIVQPAADNVGAAPNTLKLWLPMTSVSSGLLGYGQLGNPATWMQINPDYVPPPV